MSSQDGVRGQEGADGLLDVRHLGVDSIQHLGRDSRELGQVVSHNIGGSENVETGIYRSLNQISAVYFVKNVFSKFRKKDWMGL